MPSRRHSDDKGRILCDYELCKYWFQSENVIELFYQSVKKFNKISKLGIYFPCFLKLWNNTRELLNWFTIANTNFTSLPFVALLQFFLNFWAFKARVRFIPAWIYWSLDTNKRISMQFMRAQIMHPSLKVRAE